MTSRSEHDQRVFRLLADYRALPADRPVRLAKRSSNLFRSRSDAPPSLDAGELDRVLSVDPAAGTADVQAMTSYEGLVDATLPYGLMPLVVPQLKTITLGGAVTGLGIESSSFRNGCPHESVLEIEVLTGGGEIVTATPDNDHRELFRGFPNSYGSLGYATRLTIELEPVKPYVHLRHLRFGDFDALCAALARECASGEHDFVDGTVFSRDQMFLTVASFADEAPYTSDYTGMDIYYKSIRHRRSDHLRVRDYLWRWDTDWFWCSRAFGAQRPAVRRLWPKRWLRSDAYWKLVAFEKRHHPMARLDTLRGRPAREDVVQDVEIPVERTPEFLRFFTEEVGISPVWVCPLHQRDPEAVWPLYRLDPEVLYVNVGFWSTVALPDGAADGHFNRRIESEVARLDGHKSLYSTSYYEEEDFWSAYDGVAYAQLKKEYDPHGRLLDLYAKSVQRR
ncbi:MAG: FAD-binding oxidoreductase [Pseudonocardiales bacterium]